MYTHILPASSIGHRVGKNHPESTQLACYSKGMRLLNSLSLLTILLFSLTTFASSESYVRTLLGERDGGLYAGPWRPEYNHDPYFGRMELDDDQFLQNFFFRHLWQDAPQISRFLGPELTGATTCPNEVLSIQSESMRYGYRLVVMSYLLEIIDGLRHDAILLKKANTCTFNLQDLLKQCRPISEEMSAFIRGLAAQRPYQDPTVDQKHIYSKFESEWVREVQQGGKLIGSTRVFAQCQVEAKNCGQLTPVSGAEMLGRACELDKNLLTQICSEKDQLFGISSMPLITQLLITSNLMSLYNSQGYGPGCLRRYGQLMSGHERVPAHMRWTLPTTRAILLKNYGDRFPLGRAFVYGALKEFRDKGLADVFEPKIVEEVKKPVVAAAVEAKPEVVATPIVKAGPTPVPAPVVVEAPQPKPIKIPEVEAYPKSAFLLASEIRRSQNLERVDVDMLKFRYDYVFNASEMQLLATTLKDYTTREALKEMHTYDKLGSNEQPVPLTFLKYLIDSENHQGLYNLTGVLGDSFWVSNDVDVKWKPRSEFVELKNDEATNRQWQLYLIQVD